MRQYLMKLNDIEESASDGYAIISIDFQLLEMVHWD